MSADVLRDVLKSGPMAEIYARLRHVKRRLRNEPVAGPLVPADTLLGAEELRRLVPQLPDHARLLYSLGLQYLKQDQPEDMPKALTCLRSAETLGFESPDRIALHKALIAARCGRPEEAQRYLLPLVAYELTADENALREQVEQNRVEPLVILPSAASWEKASDGVQSVLVIGDTAARTAGWFADACYLLADPDVTGLPLQAVAGLGLEFETALGPAGARGLAEASGIIFSRWRDLC